MCDYGEVVYGAVSVTESRGWQSAQVTAVLDLYAAIRDGRVADVLAVTTPDICCRPLTRPGLTYYEGHQGMAELVADIHAAHGSYQVEIIAVTERPGPKVTVQARLHPPAGHGDPLAVTTDYQFRDGLIATIESYTSD
jgi:hypothetical protein